ncbi:MAG: DUF6249 domain-containing protein [Dysgonomonas sp.]|jgi:hypothetical protein|nr:hypothetical protein [Prevotella sp.]
MGELIPIIAILCAVGLPVVFGGLVLLKLMSSDKKVRMELAKQGIIPPPEGKTPPSKYTSLRNGFLCIGIAIGLVLGVIVAPDVAVTLDFQYLIIGSSVLLFLGLAYVVFYLVVKDKKEFDDAE